MENLGKSLITVIEPFNFDLKRREVFYSDFGFALVSESEYFRNSIANFCRKYHKVQQRQFSSKKVLASIRKKMKAIAGKAIKTERELLELVALFFDIAYYTATTRDKHAHLREFLAIEGTIPKYFIYCGSRDWNSIEIVERMREQIKQPDVKNAGSCFEIVQLIN